jgi:hypothetical protein
MRSLSCSIVPAMVVSPLLGHPRLGRVGPVVKYTKTGDFNIA